MKLLIISTVVSTAILLAPPSMNAGVYSDDLTRCLVESSSPSDKLDLVKWMFTAMSDHPAVKPMANITDAQRDAANKSAAELILKLLTRTCKEQSIKSIKYEGQAAFQTSFRIFGQVAAKELFSHPDVNAGLSGFTKYLDTEKLNETLGISE